MMLDEVGQPFWWHTPADRTQYQHPSSSSSAGGKKRKKKKKKDDDAQQAYRKFVFF